MPDSVRITEIIKVEPFKITCKWTTGEVRVIDFEPQFDEWKLTNYELLLPLLSFENFRYVMVNDTGTLQWVNIQTSFTGFNGEICHAPLDMCPDTLYNESKSIKYYKLVPLEMEVFEEKLAVA